MRRTVMEVMDEAQARFGPLPALKCKESGAWRTTTWREYHRQVRMVARAFIGMGLDAGGAVTIMGKNCPRWLICDLAAIYAGGIPTGIYTTDSAQQCRHIAHHSEAVIAVVENADQLARFKEVRNELPGMKAIVMMTGGDAEDYVYSWEDLPGLSEGVPESELERRISAQKPRDLCTLIYTSGTTGDPKGVMISHDNLTWTAGTVVEATGASDDDCLISYLPLSHIAEQIISLHAPMVAGLTCWFAENIDSLGNNLREVRPTIFIGVPRVWEKIQAKMTAAGGGNPFLKRKIAAWARKQGLRGGYGEQAGKAKPRSYRLADRLIFSRVRKRLGMDRCRLHFTTAAPISLDTLEFFLSLGIPLCEIFGMSECTGPATVCLPSRYRTGWAGYALPGTELRTSGDGEILIRGRLVFMGYFKDEAATGETLDSDGWLHSGDIGEIDSSGFLKITDRIKNIIITSGGENIAPQMLEAKLMKIGAINQVVIIGNNRKYLTALFTLDPEKLPGEADLAGSPATDIASAAACRKFRDYLQKQVDEVNATLARVQTIKKFTIIPHEFTIQSGDLTPTMKVRRNVIPRKYACEIDRMYTEPESG